MKNAQLHLFDHVERMSKERLIKVFIWGKLTGRPSLIWLDTISNVLKERSLNDQRSYVSREVRRKLFIGIETYGVNFFRYPYWEVRITIYVCTYVCAIFPFIFNS